VGIIACVEVTTTTTTTGTTPSATAPPIPEVAAALLTTPPSGTTIAPTSVQTTTICLKDMAQVDGAYVSSLIYTIQPVQGTNDDDLTNPISNGITFPNVQGTSGVLDENNQPLYTIKMIFNLEGVNSLSSIILNKDTNVNSFSVEFFTPSNPNQPYVSPSSQINNLPLSVSSIFKDNQASIVDFPSDVPSPLSAIRINILSTKDQQ